MGNDSRVMKCRGVLQILENAVKWESVLLTSLGRRLYWHPLLRSKERLRWPVGARTQQATATIFSLASNMFLRRKYSHAVDSIRSK
jgi:hypothetical protein